MSITPQGVTFRKRKRFLLYLIVAEALLSVFVVISLAAHTIWPEKSSAQSGVPLLLSYEGRLTNTAGNPVTDGNYCMRFSIWSHPTGGSQLWPTGTPTSTTTPVSNGVFDTLIGSADVLSFNFASSTAYLQTEVNATISTCSGSWEALSPRERIATVGYAVTASRVYGDLLKIFDANNMVQVGTGTGTGAPTKLALDVKNTSDTIGLACSPSGTLWYNSAISTALICNGGLVRVLGATSTINVSLAGNTAGSLVNINTGTWQLAGGNNITLSQNGNSVTVSAGAGGGGGGATISYFANRPFYQGAASSTMNVSGSSIWVAPFVLPAAVSASYIRIPVSMSHVSSSATHASTANTSFSLKKFQTNAIVFYSQGNGASSRSLQSVASGSAGWTIATTISHAAQSSQYTVQFNVTYPIEGVNTSNYTTSFAVSNASYQISSLSMTLFTGVRWLDIPFASSLGAGNYWIGLGRSTTTSTQLALGSAAILGASLGFSTVGNSQAASSIGLIGLATNNSLQLKPGLGWWTTNAFVSATASMALSNISGIANNPEPYFQIIRQS